MKPRTTKRERRRAQRGYLDGQMLIAMPAMSDERFARSRDLCLRAFVRRRDGHRRQPAGRQHQVSRAAGAARRHPGGRPDPAAADAPATVKVLKGGPVETGRGFVLHSADFFIENSTLPIDDGICLTATLDILKAIAHGTGPESAVLALGYAGWAPGQLETEIQDNGWLQLRGRPRTDLRHRHRGQIREGAAQDRHRARQCCRAKPGTPRAD